MMKNENSYIKNNFLLLYINQVITNFFNKKTN